MAEAVVRFKYKSPAGLPYRKSSASADTIAEAETLGAKRMALKVGDTISARLSQDLDKTDYPTRNNTDQYQDMVLIFFNSTTDEFKDTTERDVSLHYKLAGGPNLVDITNSDITDFADAWIAAEADRSGFQLQGTSHFLTT